MFFTWRRCGGKFLLTFFTRHGRCRGRSISSFSRRRCIRRQDRRIRSRRPGSMVSRWYYRGWRWNWYMSNMSPVEAWAHASGRWLRTMSRSALEKFFRWHRRSSYSTLMMCSRRRSYSRISIPWIPMKI